MEWYKNLALVGGTWCTRSCSFYGQILALFCAPEEDAHNGRLSVADASAFLDGDDRLRRPSRGSTPATSRSWWRQLRPRRAERGGMQDQRNPITGNPKRRDKRRAAGEGEGGQLRLGDGISNSTVGTVKTVMFTDVDVATTVRSDGHRGST